MYKAYSSNLNTECSYYQESRKYAIINNTDKEQTTTFYYIDGKATEICVKANDIVWL